VTPQDDDARPDATEVDAAAEEPLRRLLEKLSAEHGFDFRDYKLGSLSRRIDARRSQVGVDTLDAYIRHLDRHPEEAAALFDTILINVTSFFRDPEAWEALRQEVVPELIQVAAETRTIRVWCAACSSGEEAYSVAIVLADAIGDRAHDFDIKIYGTDIDEDALASARQALYRLEQLKAVPAPPLERYFQRDGQLYRFRRDLRRWCIFGRHNLSQDAPLPHIDLLVCRNVLIYFKSDLQERLLGRFLYAIRPQGFLFLGKSESLLARSKLFTAVRPKWRLFQRTAEPVVRPEATAIRADHEATAASAAATARHLPERVATSGMIARIVEAAPLPLLLIDAADTVHFWNHAAALLYEMPANVALARKFRDLDISYRVEGMRARVEHAKASQAASRLDDVRFTKRSGEVLYLQVQILPIVDGGRTTAIVVSALDVTEQTRLSGDLARIAEQHAMASEELQSTNEELETTNEELQSTNEELETTNEELQSTNEELLTTIDEVQASHDQLATRTTELRRIELYHRSILQSMTDATVVLDREFKVTTWNEAAEQLWGLPAAQAVGRDFFALPLGPVIELMRNAIRTSDGELRVQGTVDVEFPLPSSGKKARMRLVRLGDDDDPVGVVGIVSSAWN